MPASISMSACAGGGYVAVLSDILLSADPWGGHSVLKFNLLENLSLKGKIKQWNHHRVPNALSYAKNFNFLFFFKSVFHSFQATVYFFTVIHGVCLMDKELDTRSPPASAVTHSL